MKACVKLVGFMVAAIALTTNLRGGEINGKVTRVNGGAVEVSTDSQFLPNPGDQAEIYYKIQGLDDPIHVAAGRVSGIHGATIHIKIDQPTARIVRGYLVRMTSDRPRRVEPQPDGSDNQRGPQEALPNQPRPMPPASQPIRVDGTTLRGHTGFISAIGFAADGQRMLSVATVPFRENQVIAILWDVTAGREVRRFNLDSPMVRHVAFYDGGRSGACVDAAGWVHCWNLQSGQHFVSSVATNGPVHTAAFSTDGATAALAFTPAANNQGAAVPPSDELHVCDFRPTGTTRFNSSSFHGAISGLTFTDHGKRLMAIDDRQIFLWEVETGKLIAQSPNKLPGFEHMALSRGGRFAVVDPPPPTAGEEQRLEALDRENARRLLDSIHESERRLQSQAERSQSGPHPPTQVVDPEGRPAPVLKRPQFESHNFIRTVDVRTGNELRRFELPNTTPIEVAVSPDARYVAAASTMALFVWDVATGRMLCQSPVQCCVKQMTFSPDSRAIVVINPDTDFTLQLIKIPN